MNQNISMIRFLMFMILALIIFFNIAPQLVEDDSDNNKTDADNDKDANKENETVGNYCLIDGETHADKKCKEVSPDDSCQNRFTSLKECKEWKGALAIDETNDEDGDVNYNYTTDDIDKLTIMDSDDMIYCLKNDKKCEKMKFGDCNDIHISTYLSKKNCLEAKDKIKENKNDEDDSYDERYCLIGDTCKKQDESNDCGDSKTYCNMNKCKQKNNVTQDEGEYCFYNGDTTCKELDCGDNCSGSDKYYKSLSTCKSNNGLS